jgi:hypothetical protein
VGNNLTFGEPEFFASSHIHDYCNNIRTLMRPLVSELHVSAEELEAALKHVKSVNPQAFGLDSRVRAKLVAAHLRRASEAAEVMCASAVRTYLSFRKHYVAEIDMTAKNRGRNFQFDK